MKHILLILILASTALGAAAQQFGCSWIALGSADSASQVWFRRTYVSASRPRQAFITIASTGFFTLYVNGRNVSRAVRTPSRAATDTLARSMTFRIDRFLRPDTNTIAVWYSPTFPRIERRQISVCLHGTYASGSTFAHWSDGSWQCRRANMSLTGGGGECQQAADSSMPWWKAGTEAALWQAASEEEGRQGESVASCPWGAQGSVATHIMAPRYFDTEPGGVAYDFAPGFRGIVRITLRGCTPGEHINVDGLKYTCSGDNDEQAFRRFTTTFRRKVLVSGDSRFSPEQIQSVEAVEIADAPAF